MTPCECPICRFVRAADRSDTKAMSEALDAYLDLSEERGMAYAYLLSEVEDVLRLGLGIDALEAEQRLRRAVEVTTLRGHPFVEIAATNGGADR
jgi:hypothetical protein